jgi:NAD(P)-dependent dehydrogenase (short-subunit alcohol dehydrogenase family)
LSGRLQGKVAIVTGAGGGIGGATVRKFIAEGASVGCVDIDGEALTELMSGMDPEGQRVLALEGDVSTERGNRDMVARVCERFGGLDVLHANAAIQHMARVDETSESDWESLFRTNLLGVGLGVAAALPALRARGGGSVVITASLLGLVGDPDMPAYGAMKGGLRAMCRSLAAAHGSENIRFNAICPADVETPMLNEFFEHQPDGAEARRRILDNYPLGRFASPEDVANVAAFLASDEAHYLTGIDLVVDGGLLARIY